MRRISTGAERLLTTDAVADAVVTYATVLVRANTADTITIPIVRDDGEQDEARMLLGPASQLTIVPDGDFDDTALKGAKDVVDDLQRRTAHLEPTYSAQEQPNEDLRDSFPDFDQYD